MKAPAALHCIAFLWIVKPSALVTQVFNRKTRKDMAFICSLGYFISAVISSGQCVTTQWPQSPRSRSRWAAHFGQPLLPLLHISNKTSNKNIACDLVIGCSWAGVFLHCCCTIFTCAEPYTPSVAFALSVMSAFLSPSLFLSLNWGSLSNSETSLGQRTARFVPSFKPRQQSPHVNQA